MPATPPWTRPCCRRRSASRCACRACATKAPAGTRRRRPRSTSSRAALDKDGKVTAWQFETKAFSRARILQQRRLARAHARRPAARLAAQAGLAVRPAGRILRLRRDAQGVDHDPAAARSRLAAALVAHARSGRAADALRGRILHGRAGARHQHGSGRVPPALSDEPARHGACIKAAAEKANWQPRVGARKQQNGDVSHRPGHRLCGARRHPRRRSSPRSRSTAAPARSGRRRFIVAHDCGQIIAPDLLRLTIEGNIVQTTSRAL